MTSYRYAVILGFVVFLGAPIVVIFGAMFALLAPKPARADGRLE